MIVERHKELPHETILGSKGEVEANMCISIINRLMNYAINNFELPDGTSILPVNPVRDLYAIVTGKRNHVAP